jgi:hypothetical protein
MLELAAFIGVRVRPTERDALLAMAAREQMTISEKIRDLITREALRDIVQKEPAGV